MLSPNYLRVFDNDVLFQILVSIKAVWVFGWIYFPAFSPILAISAALSLIFPPHSCLQTLAQQIFCHYLFFWSGDKSEALILGVIYRQSSGDSNQRAVKVNLELELVCNGSASLTGLKTRKKKTHTRSMSHFWNAPLFPHVLKMTAISCTHLLILILWSL